MAAAGFSIGTKMCVVLAILGAVGLSYGTRSLLDARVQEQEARRVVTMSQAAGRFSGPYSRCASNGGASVTALLGRAAGRRSGQDGDPGERERVVDGMRTVMALVTRGERARQRGDA